MATKDEQESLNIRLKLLDENNVILVKCSGFATEIFMPTIIDGRLSIINVVPQRRCRCISTNFIVAKKSKHSEETLSQTIPNWHVSSDFDSALQASTPDQLRNNVTSTRRNDILKEKPAVYRSLQFDEALSSDDISLPSEIGSFHLLDQSDVNPMQSNVFSENPSTNFRIPLGSLSNMEWPQTSFIGKESPGLNVSQGAIQLSGSHLPTLPRWRKVLTPVRTYSRHKYTSSNNKLKEEEPVFLTSSTEGIKPMKSVVKIKQNSSTIIDEKIKISPKSFKRQFKYKNSQDLYRKTLQEHKDRETEVTKKTAYELFTTPTLQSNFSQKLKTQYKSRCYNKGASTCAKYKNLAQIEASPN